MTGAPDVGAAAPLHGAPDGVELVEVPLADLLPARATFSYAGRRSPDAALLPGDTDPRTVHLLARTGSGVVGAATLTWDPTTLPDGETATWRLRGLGVAEHAQHRGIGGALVAHQLRLVAERGHRVAWCTARDHHVARATRLGATALGPVQVPGSNAPDGTTHTLLRWTAPPATSTHPARLGAPTSRP